MSKVLVIGCGGVASVAISKCCQVSDVFHRAVHRQPHQSPSAMRWPQSWRPPPGPKSPPRRSMPTTCSSCATSSNSYKPDLVMNIALPYQDLTIMDACLACGV